MNTNRTAKEVLNTLACGVAEDVNKSDPRYDWRSIHREVAAQQLLADILSLPEMQDDPQFLEDGSPNPMPYETHNIRERQRASFRLALQDYFMGGDVGVDVGASEEPTPLEQVGGKQVDKSSETAVVKLNYFEHGQKCQVNTLYLQPDKTIHIQLDRMPGHFMDIELLKHDDIGLLEEFAEFCHEYYTGCYRDDGEELYNYGYSEEIVNLVPQFLGKRAEVNDLRLDDPESKVKA